MTGVVAHDFAGYEKVADLIGRGINKSLQDLLKGFIEDKDISSFAANGLLTTSSDLENFLIVLGSVELEIEFIPKFVKRKIIKFTALDLESPPTSSRQGIEFSIGGRWTY